MRYKIIFSEASKEDIKSIDREVFNICLDKKTAKQYVKGIINKIVSKSDFPESGIPLVYRDETTEYRFVIYKAYLVFYKFENDVITVVRVLPGKSDYCKELLLKDN